MLSLRMPVEALEEAGRRVFAVRTNALAALPVRPGYASYGAETLPRHFLDPS